MTEERIKVHWITTQELNNMLNSAREIEHPCPYCKETYTYPLSNGDVFDIASYCLELECPFCKKLYALSWEGDEGFERTDDYDLPF